MFVIPPIERGILRAVPLTTSHKRWLLVGGIVLATLAGIVFGLQRMLLFPSSMARASADAGEGVVGRQQLWLQIRGGRVEAWFLPGDGVDADHPGPVVVFAHGNAETIDQWPPTLRHYQERGISVLLPEYRGYGRSKGSPSESAIVDDVLAFYDLIVERPDVDAQRVILHGRSLGGGVVGSVLGKRPAAAVILQSTFTSVADLANEKWWVPRFVILDPFDTRTALGKYEGPVLVVHGRDDELIPPAHAEALAEAAPNGSLVMFDGGHNNTPPSVDELWAVVDPFLAEAGVLALK